MKTFVLTPLAARDLSEIWNYLAEENIALADRVLTAIEFGLRKLVRAPGIGHIREDLASRQYGFFLIHSYLIVYRRETDPLQVIRVLHASRDVQVLLALAPE